MERPAKPEDTQMAEAPPPDLEAIDQALQQPTGKPDAKDKG